MGRGKENEYLVLICIIRKLSVIFGPKDKHMQSAESAKIFSPGRTSQVLAGLGMEFPWT